MSRLVRSGFVVIVALGLLAAVPVLAGDDQAGRVMVTRPGVVFHKAGADDIRGRAVERTVDAALEAGYAPCPVCFAKEIASAREVSTAMPGAAATAILGDGSIPAPPVGVVTQPFGLRFASNAYGRNRKEAIPNPYESVNSAAPGASEQGAFGEH